MTRAGTEFANRDVVEAYRHRTDYPAGLYDRLLALGPGRTRLLDLGCGPGKLARRLAPHFCQVLAADPSEAMLLLGQELDSAAHPHIRWINATAEAIELQEPVDLIVAGASLHWMDAGSVLPKLAQVLTPAGMMAVINGDGPAAAPWFEAWQNMIIDWVERRGGVWNGAAYQARGRAYEPWFDIKGGETFTAAVSQTIGDLIEAEHSRATWARVKMGDQAAQFDADLGAVLRPHAIDGIVNFTVRSTVIWGRPRSFRYPASPDSL